MKKNNYEVLLFDLDGTLTDPGAGITNSVAYALQKHGIHVEDKRELYKFIGPPLMDSFQDFYAMTEEQARKAVEDYREYFSDRGIYENEIYKGMEGFLQRLCAAGKKLVVATSKPEKFARIIIDYFHLSGCFAYVAGSGMDNRRTQKWEVIEYALQTCGITDRTKAVMIGDRMHDVIGAKKCGLDSIGVLYGYGSLEELTNAGAAYIARELQELEDILLP